ncbi:hypothetical protein Tco_0802192 [Tanacetum coccineum]|uniref:Uncharacterized protein n=1 Tax=Tanacetum coccineum TaxID=301880 RepID=A0ABQ4ZY32_9ASTR
MNDGTPMCERHDTNYIQSEGYQNRDSHDSYSHQSHHDPNDSEKSLTELNNDVKSDLEDFHSYLKKSITKFLDGQRFASMYIKNNVNDMSLKKKQNEKNFQTIFKNIERKIDEWKKSQNVSSEQTNRTEPLLPPQAQTKQVNVVFTVSGKFDDSLKI